MKARAALLLLALLSARAAAQITPGEALAAPILRGSKPGNPLVDMPAGQRLVSPFGERPVFSPDGRKLAFIGDSYGDAFEVELTSGRIRNLTAGIPHRGFLRIHYLRDGSYLLLGPRLLGAERKETREKHIELFWLNRAADRPLVPLGATVFEGIAASRQANRIAWTEIRPVGATIRTAQEYLLRQAEILVESGGARLGPVEELGAFSDCTVEAQDYLPGDRGLTLPCYHLGAQYPKGVWTEILSYDFASRAITRIPWNAKTFGEIEGIFPDGRRTLVECSDDRSAGMDLCIQSLDPARPQPIRLTHAMDHGRYRYGNPVVSKDGLIAASIGPADTAEPGMGLGIVLIDLHRQ